MLDQFRFFFSVAVLWASGSAAGYKFLTQNPYEAQKQLFDDARTGHLDVSSVAPSVVEAAKVEAQGAITPARLNQLGAITQICLNFAVRSKTSSALSFRTHHTNGCGSWLVRTDTSPEIVTNVIMFPLALDPEKPDRCLTGMQVAPMPPMQGESFIFPDKLKCRSADNLSPPAQSDGDLEAACQIVSGMCPRGH
jgi:hypothetical protein